MSLPSHAGSAKKRLPETPTLAPSTTSNDTTEAEPGDPDIDLLRSYLADGDHAADMSTNDGLESHRILKPMFEIHLQRLKEYINVFGTTSVVAADCWDERFARLKTFLYERRRDARDIAKGRYKPSSYTFARIRELLDLGVDLGVDRKKIYQPGFLTSDDHGFISRGEGV
jgi:hypothetical protein